MIKLNDLKQSLYICKKRCVYLCITIFITVAMLMTVVAEAAPSFSISGPGSVKPNTTFTVSFGSGTAGSYSYSVSGGTLLSGPSWVEGGGSLSVKAGGSGTVTVTVTAGNVTTSDYQDIAPGTSRSVSVSITAPQVTPPTSSGNSGSGNSGSGNSGSGNSGSGNNNTTQDDVDDRSSDNLLSSLSINNVQLSPVFNSGTFEYTAEVWDVEEITIAASARDGKAKVSGTGSQVLRLGENPFDIVVTAENQSKKTYRITVIMNQKPTIFLEHEGEKLGVVKNLSEVQAFSSFDKCELEINGEEAEGWYSTLLDLTIIYLVDDNEECGFYVYEEGKILSRIESVTIKEQNYFVFSLGEEEQKRLGYIYEEFMMNDISIMGWRFEGEGLENYRVFQLMNTEGVSNDYLYSISEGTFILAPDLAPISYVEYEALVKQAQESLETTEKLQGENQQLDKKNNEQSTLIVVLVVIIVILSVLIVLLGVFLITFIRKNPKKLDRNLTELIDGAELQNVDDGDVDNISEDLIYDTMETDELEVDNIIIESEFSTDSASIVEEFIHEIE